MTPKEKAIELFDKYYEFDFNTVWVNKQRKLAKQCALIAVDEILKNDCGANTDGQQAYENELYCDEYFWDEVKTELEKL